MYYGTLTGVSVGANTIFPFTTHLNTNLNISDANGKLTIIAPGYYRVHFDASVAGVGDITPTLVINGVASQTAFSTATSTSATDYEAAVFETVLYVKPAYNQFVTIQINNTGVAATVTDANLIVDKIQ